LLFAETLYKVRRREEEWMTKLNNRKDILLLLLYAPGKTEKLNEPIVGKTRLIKMLFLFKKEALQHFCRDTEISAENFYEFFPWNFGPFSSQVYDDLMFFILRGFIASSVAHQEGLPESEEEWEKWLDESGTSEIPQEIDPYEEETFVLTDTGIKFTKQIYDSLSQSQQKLLKEFKSRLSAAPLRAILRYVYETYPEEISSSIIKEEVLA
jgi:uncharacterized protein YwgA